MIKVPKKRGRKPKGGVIIESSQINNVSNNNTINNIIIHLKCNIKDINCNNYNTLDIKQNKKPLLNFKEFDNDNENNKDSNTNDDTKFCVLKQNSISKSSNIDIKIEENNNSNTNIESKLKDLHYKLHHNIILNTRSACFWCTCNFDTPTIYIPKYELNNTYHVYGCFCTPQCAVAYLLQENINTSIKFERYYLLNHIYGEIYDYNINFKPAPNPYYILDKYYGNLTIEEYRKILNNNNKLLLIIDKPMTKMTPELHDNNETGLLNNNSSLFNSKIIYNKSNILKDNFGIIN